MAVPVPQHLSKASRSLWRRVATDYDLAAEPHALRVLTLLGEALDRGEEARQRIAVDGAYVTDRFGQVRAHPAISVERDSAIRAARLARELSLDAGDGLPGDLRIPRPGGKLT